MNYTAEQQRLLRSGWRDNGDGTWTLTTGFTGYNSGRQVLEVPAGVIRDVHGALEIEGHRLHPITVEAEPVPQELKNQVEVVRPEVAIPSEVVVIQHTATPETVQEAETEVVDVHRHQHEVPPPPEETPTLAPVEEPVAEVEEPKSERADKPHHTHHTPHARHKKDKK